MRQLGEMWPDDVIAANKRGVGKLLRVLLGKLAETLGAEALHLDHDPALGAREKVFKNGEHVGYRPAANDPEHLIYRDAAAHRVKTNVRGEHGQHPDRVLIKKQRRRERPTSPKRKTAWKSRPLRSASRWPKGRKLTCLSG